MKNILNIVTLLLISINTYAQVNITDYDGKPTVGTYYQDFDNLLDPFVGTYVYTNGNFEKLTFEFRKMIHSNSNNLYYEDLLVGEYKYEKKGNIIANTLDRFNLGYTDGNAFSVSTNLVVTGNRFGYTDCAPNEKWIYGILLDCLSDRNAYFFIRKKMINGQEAIQIDITWRIDGIGRNRGVDEPPTPQPALPGKIFTLIKQP